MQIQIIYSDRSKKPPIREYVLPTTHILLKFPISKAEVHSVNEISKAGFLNALLVNLTPTLLQNLLTLMILLAHLSAMILICLCITSTTHLILE